MTNYTVHDTKRDAFYSVDADTPALALKAVQNDQWAEQLDPATVTPLDELRAAETVRITA